MSTDIPWKNHGDWMKGNDQSFCFKFDDKLHTYPVEKNKFEVGHFKESIYHMSTPFIAGKSIGEKANAALPAHWKVDWDSMDVDWDIRVDYRNTILCGEKEPKLKRYEIYKIKDNKYYKKKIINKDPIICATCTYENPYTAKECEICGHNLS